MLNFKDYLNESEMIEEFVNKVFDDNISVEEITKLYEMAITDAQVKMRQEINKRKEGFKKQCDNGNESACKIVKQLNDKLAQLKLK